MTFRPDPKPVKREKEKKSFRTRSLSMRREIKNSRDVKRELKLMLLEQISRIQGKEIYKLPSLKRVTKMLDTVFSVYVRLRDAQGMKTVKCITCPAKKKIKKMQNGHYVSRRYIWVRWHEKNGHAQCPGCNMFKKGAPDVYALRLVKMYGKDILEELNKEKNRPGVMDLFERLRLLEYYQMKVKQLKKQIQYGNISKSNWVRPRRI